MINVVTAVQIITFDNWVNIIIVKTKPTLIVIFRSNFDCLLLIVTVCFGTIVNVSFGDTFDTIFV